jgi:hypothetical protein
MRPGTPHDGLDVGPGTGQMLSTYIVEIGAAGDPRRLSVPHRKLPEATDALMTAATAAGESDIGM